MQNNPVNYVDPDGRARYRVGGQNSNWGQSNINAYANFLRNQIRQIDPTAPTGSFRGPNNPYSRSDIAYLQAMLFRAQNAGFCGPGAANAPFVPSSHWNNYAPRQVEPGAVRRDYQRTSGRTGDLENSRMIYDQFGRALFRIDYTNHRRSDHSNPHLHEYIYGPIYNPYREIRHNLWSQ